MNKTIGCNFEVFTTEPVMGFSAPETSGSARVRLSHPLFRGLQPSDASFLACGARCNRKSP